MKKYGNIRFNRRVVAFVCLLVVAVNFLIPKQTVRADDYVTYTKIINAHFTDEKGRDCDYVMSVSVGATKPFYSVVFRSSSDSSFMYGFVMPNGCKTDDSFYQRCNVAMYIDGVRDTSVTKPWGSTGIYLNKVPSSFVYGLSSKCSYISSNCEYQVVGNTVSDAQQKFLKFLNGESVDGVSKYSDYKPNEKAYNEIGCLDNVQMETYITNKKELDFADENADLAKINQDKVIVYSSSTTTGIDLSKGGYKVQLYGSYAWQDKSGNIKSEDKGHKTFIKDWYAENNIKGLNRSKYTWIDWKTANDIVETDKTDKAHKPNAFEKMTTYANYQYEPIWYLRIVSQDNKYGAWVKLYNSTNKGKYRSQSVDDDDNAVPDSGGGYNKPKDTSEITGTGDTPEDAKNNVPKAEEKQDTDDLNDSANGNNSTFDKLEQFTKGIGDVPKMIADIFSFLPSWCLEVVAIGFALLMILVVVKFIRG